MHAATVNVNLLDTTVVNRKRRFLAASEEYSEWRVERIDQWRDVEVTCTYVQDLWDRAESTRAPPWRVLVD